MPEIEQLNNRITLLENLIFDFIREGKYKVSKNIQMQDGRNFEFNTGTGTRLGTATGQKLGFFNTTPIIQQTTTSQTPSTFAANTSGIVDDSATWAGYTIGDIVAILRAFGLIA